MVDSGDESGSPGTLGRRSFAARSLGRHTGVLIVTTLRSKSRLLSSNSPTPRQKVLEDSPGSTLLRGLCQGGKIDLPSRVSAPPTAFNLSTVVVYAPLGVERDPLCSIALNGVPVVTVPAAESERGFRRSRLCFGVLHQTWR